MSAINPASFVTPAAGLQPPSAIGPGSLGAGRDSPSERRRQAEYKSQVLGQPQTSPSAFGDPADNSRDFISGQIQGLRSPYINPYQSFGPGLRHSGLGLTSYGQAMQPPNDAFSSYAPSAYPIIDNGLAEYNTSPVPGVHAGRRGHLSNTEWISGFHGLSLGP